METMLERIKKGSLLSYESARQEIRSCNALSEQYGLSLNEEEIAELVECRAEALKNTGRVEFGGGILPKLITAFCDSPYIEKDSYKETLEILQEAFYTFKSESEDAYTDDDLIGFMAAVYNGRAQGSAEYLLGTSIEHLCRYAERKYDPYDADDAGDLF